jgi:hypothetical protein
MTLQTILICAGGLVLVSCNSGEQSSKTGNGEASGTYVREYAFEVTHSETGNKIGMRQVRDSIFIVAHDEGYQVTNHKWMMNDYDQNGWVSMAHADDRPLPTFFASYDERSEQLNSSNPNISKSIFIDMKNNKLLMNSSGDIEYIKIN